MEPAYMNSYVYTEMKRNQTSNKVNLVFSRKPYLSPFTRIVCVMTDDSILEPETQYLRKDTTC